MQKVAGAPKNLQEEFQKYNLEIPDLSPAYNDEFRKLLVTEFAAAPPPDTKRYHCEICTVCSLCLLCAEVNAAAGAGSISSILALFNSATARA